MASRKPVPGICGICGCAQVRPAPEEIRSALLLAVDAECWVNGHLYEDIGYPLLKLRKVRCLEHAEEFDPRRQALTWH